MANGLLWSVIVVVALLVFFGFMSPDQVGAGAKAVAEGLQAIGGAFKVAAGWVWGMIPKP